MRMARVLGVVEQAQGGLVYVVGPVRSRLELVQSLGGKYLTWP